MFSEVVHQPTRVRPQGDRSAIIVPLFGNARVTMTVHRMRILLRGAGLLTLVLALAACATVTRLTPEQTAAADRAEQLYRVGEFERAANEFMALARDRGAASGAHYRLRAAEAYRESGDLDRAARALGSIKHRHLEPSDQMRLDLLDAEIALAAGDAARARTLLAFPENRLPENLRLRALELRARSDVLAGDRFAAARARAQLDRLLSGTDRAQNREELLRTLAALEPGVLRARYETLRPDDALVPWIEEALRDRGEALPRALARADRPVGTLLPGDDGSLAREGYRRLEQIALLLPLSGGLANVSQPIRDGFLAAHFAAPAEQRPAIRLYDSGVTPEDALAAYRRAIDEGADHVVGPLQREAVGLLFHQPLPVPTLALNHPDTGEVPPPGNAEYGLLPDAEGAQAAEHMLQRGILQAAVIIAEADWAERAARAFRAQFEAGGGRIAGEARLADDTVDYQVSITHATAGLGSGPDAGVFISMRPRQARLLLPQMKIARIAAPVFATSHTYSGDSNPGLNRDLDGVEFCDAPWLLGDMPGTVSHEQMTRDFPGLGGIGARLFAFGMDAYALLPYLDWLLGHPDAYLDGATGQLTADPFGRIHRLMSWARFVNGVAQPVQGALSASPVPLP